jgi:hypothetical protein
MPLLSATAGLLSLEQMEKGVIDEIVYKDEIFSMLPFEAVNSKAYVYNRENTIAGGAFLSVNSNVPEQASDFTQVTANLSILAGDVDIDKFLQTTQSDTNDQTAIQLAQKAKGLGIQFKTAMVAGDKSVDVNSFDGMSKLVDSGQVIVAGTNGAALSLSMLDELKDACYVGSPDAFVMRRGTYRAYKALLRAAGGTRPDMIEMENFGKLIPTHDGVPILVSDFIPHNVAQGSASDTTSIFAARFNEVDGLHGIVGGDMGGFSVEEIGTVQNRDAYRYRLKWYVSLVLKSTLSLAAVRGVTNV